MYFEKIPYLVINAAKGEAPPSQLYHGSKKMLKKRAVLKPQRTGYVHGSGFDSFEQETILRCENFLEKHRPKGAISRSTAVFMTEAPDQDIIEKAGGYATFVYRVEPIGAIWRSGLKWYSLLYSLCEDTNVPDKIAAEFANEYWNGAKTENSGIFEYLARSAAPTKLLNPPGQ